MYRYKPVASFHQLIGSDRGFTLLETITAAVLLGIAIALACTSFAWPIRQFEKTKSTALSARSLRNIHETLSLDFANLAMPYPNTKLALQGSEHQLDFFTYAPQDPESELAHITYQWQENDITNSNGGSLLRIINSTDQHESISVPLLQAMDLQITYYNTRQRTWSPTWNLKQEPGLPSLIRFTVLIPEIQDEPIDLVYPIYVGREYTRNGIL